MATRKQPGSTAGTIGWAALAAAVLAWDLLAPETLSDAFGRGCASQPRRAITIGAWVILTAHLFDVLPERADPLHRAWVAGARARQAARPR